ncbi:MAG: 4a-hydroxytetrahydrobiopterin dehydratase [Acidimicrobiia bacterium]|nr:4a-hydroxytetrahydrobiopterin dehydratase [Acidimicrobiia bacterium]MDX2468475.1 4a-hydroxytetrahydrobiopterin dehydratase [Acidimicrobiia bacterium]
MARLEQHDRIEFLASNAGWELDGETIKKTYVLGDFSQAIGFVTRVAMLAEVADHHPDIDIRWNRVTIVLSTHDEQSLTAKDTSLAIEIEAL